MHTGKVNKAEQNTSVHSKKYKKIIVTATVALVVLVLVDIYTPIWGGQIKYYAKWAECGQRPQQMSGRIAWHIEYHELSPVFNPFRDNHMKYFCTAKEAEMNGLSSTPDSYDFPNLTQEEYEKSRSILRKNDPSL